jgi:glycosyltransferase involved in cell wall biosynthesis
VSARGDRRILQLTVLPFPPEIRVVKEGISLAAAGFQSAVLCPPIKGRPARETWRGVQVFRPASLGRSSSTADKLIFQTTFFSPAWFGALEEVLAEYPADVVHVHDIWLGRTVFRAARGRRIVMDLHENMPAAVVEQTKALRGMQKWFNRIFRGAGRTLRYERAMLQKSDRVFVVVQEARDRALETHPCLDASKVINIENLESKSFVAGSGSLPPVIGKDHFSILYIGGFGPHRGIDTLVTAMRHVKAWGLNVRVHLVGAQKGSYSRMVEEQIRACDVGSHVTVTGWVPPEMVLAYISQASVCAVPHHANPHTDTTIPHKLYQYMIASRPVFVSSSAPLARTVRAAGAGVIFEAGNDVDCAEKIRAMQADPAGLEAAGARGFRYVMEQGHNWEDESAPALVDAYDRLLGVSR